MKREVRCSQTRRKRDGQTVVLCDRFIAMMDENGSIRVKCPCCGTNYLFVPQAVQGPKVVRLVDEDGTP